MTMIRPSSGDLSIPVEPTAAAEAADFEAAYAHHYRDVHRYLLGLTRSVDEADDLAAETFERAFRAWTSRAVQDRTLPWLLLTARRLATDRWRRARRLARLLPRTVNGRSASAGEVRTDFWLWFDAVARVLTDRQREVLVLRYQRDLTDADIAAVMGISESGVRSLVGRAVEVLRNHPELLP
jgi:RNA polymerase sigma-70 factor, ECF subfamily